MFPVELLALGVMPVQCCATHLFAGCCHISRSCCLLTCLRSCAAGGLSAAVVVCSRVSGHMRSYVDCCSCIFGLQVLQCLHIMITSRQQQLAEAAACQEAATRQASGSTAEVTQDLDSAACGLDCSNSRSGLGGANRRSSSCLAAPAGVLPSVSDSRNGPQPSAALPGDPSWMTAGLFGPQDL
jgi:hypothetical protein